MPKKEFLIVTLVDENIPGLNADICRDVFYKYKYFHDVFDVIDIRKYDQKNNSYELTIIDRFATAALMIWGSLTYKKLIKMFKYTKNLVFLTSDLHYWSLFPNTGKLPQNFIESNLVPSSNNYLLLFKLFQKLGIKHLITHYECPELEYIKSHSKVDAHIINYHIDPNVYRDYKFDKLYDIIFYGAVTKSVYRFRHRLKDLLKDSKFRIIIIDPSDGIRGVALAKLINQSWLGVATVSNFSYLVGKYFEISACNTTVLGNMNGQGKAIWEDSYIHVDEHMTDEEIITTIENALSNKDLLRDFADCMYQKIQSFHTLEKEKEKLYQLCQSIEIRETA